jgi:hypothetical protein
MNLKLILFIAIFIPTIITHYYLRFIKKVKIKPYVYYPIMWGILGPFVITFPFLGTLILLPLTPLTKALNSLVPGNFISTGPHVEIGFAWIVLKSPASYFFYTTVIIFAGFIVGLIVHLIGKFKQKRDSNIPH